MSISLFCWPPQLSSFSGDSGCDALTHHITISSCVGCFYFSWCIQAGKMFQEIFPPQSYAKSVAAIRLPSHSHCSWAKRTGLEMWAVNLGVTIHLARAHHPRWKKTLVKVTNKQLLGKSSSSTKASVLGYAKSSSSPAAANHSVFLHCSSVYHLQCLLMCNYIQLRAPGLLCLVMQLSGRIRISCLWISSIHVQHTSLCLSGGVSWRNIVRSSFLTRWTNSSSPIWNFSNSSSNFLVLTSFWTDSRPCKVSVSLDCIEKTKIPLSLWISRDDMEHGRKISSQ